jgi:hypothetical protein
VSSASRLLAAAFIVFGTASVAGAQALKDVHTSDAPLVLKAQGSFFVGGETIEQTQRERR